MEADNCNSDFFQIFINELSSTNMDELMLILLDNASFHKAKKLKIPDNLALIHIPPYTPELNHAEKIWQKFKRAFTNNPFKTMEDVRIFLTEQTHLLTDETVIATCSYKWIVSWNNWTV